MPNLNVITMQMQKTPEHSENFFDAFEDTAVPRQSGKLAAIYRALSRHVLSLRIKVELRK